jgi:hypothetical protein
MRPVYTPVALLMVTVLVVLLDQVPPETESESVVELPLHTSAIPVITDGNGLMLKVSSVAPQVLELVMVTEPPEIPVTTPALLTVAIAVALDDQVPPLTASEILLVVPAQNVVVPVKVEGAPFTVIF